MFLGNADIDLGQVGRNLIHGSDGAESAAKEIALWFPEAEHGGANWQRSNEKWIHEKPL